MRLAIQQMREESEIKGAVEAQGLRSISGRHNKTDRRKISFI